MTPSDPAFPPVPGQSPVAAPVCCGDDKLWMVASHLSLLVGFGFLVPFVVWLAKRQDSPIVSEHAREALNFHISVYLYGILLLPLVFLLIGIPLLVLLGVGSMVLAVIAGVEASHGRLYRYPLCLRLIS